MSIYNTYNLRVTASGNFLSESTNNYFPRNMASDTFHGYPFEHFLGVLRGDRRFAECYLAHIVILNKRLHEIILRTLDEYALMAKAQQMKDWAKNECN